MSDRQSLSIEDQVRRRALEEAALLHEQVTVEGRREDAMAAVIEYRDLIRARAKEVPGE